MQAAEFHETCAQFLQTGTAADLEPLDAALARVDASVVDVGDTESILKRLKPLIASPSAGLRACLVVLRFKRLHPGNQWVGSVLEDAASTFRDAAINRQPGLADAVRLWTEIAQDGHLEEHLFYPLFTAALAHIFPTDEAPADRSIARKMVNLVAASYQHLPPKAREEIVHQLISAWRKCPLAGSEMTDLLLRIVAKAGQVPEAVWDEAVTFKSRNSLESAAHAAHARAREVSFLISRRLIDMHWAKPQTQRTELTALLEECLRRCHRPQWAAADVLLSAFTTTLFRLAAVIRAQKYPLFMLDTLRTMYPGMAALYTAPEPPVAPSKLPDLVVALARGIRDRDQALYLISRQMVEPNQPFFDYHHAYMRPQASLDDDYNSWPAVLNQWQQSRPNYHEQIVRMLCDMAARPDLKDTVQVALFKVLETVIEKDFTKFDMAWMDRLGSAVPTVCETFIPIASHMYEVTHNEEIMHKLAVRLHGPGANQYKRKVLGLVMRRSQSLSLKWQLLLILVTDTDHSVRNYSLQLAQEWLKAHGATEELAQALADAEARDAGKHQLTVQQGLRVLMKHLDRLDISRIQALVSSLINNNQLRLALVFISGDGRVTPTPCIRPLFAQKSDLALTIINYALCSRPRMILAPSLTETMFTELVPKLKTASESELVSIGSILGQLVSLGGLSTQEKRKTLLNRVFASSFDLARRNVSTGNRALLTQAVLICGAARFWPVSPAEIISFAHTLTKWTADEPHAEVRLLFVRTVFALASHNEELFTDKVVDEYFSSFPRASDESHCLTRQLLKLLWTPRALTAASSTSYLGTSSTTFETVSALLLQKQLDRLIAIAYAGEDVNALRVIVKAMNDNLVVADECVPLVTSLAFSRDPAVAQTALKSFATICERWPRNLGPNFVEGLRHLPPELTSNPPLAVMWRMIGQNRQHMKALLQSVATLLDPSVDLLLLKILINGLTSAEMDAVDAKYLVQLIEESSVMFDPAKHDSEQIAKACLIFIFGLWLRRNYGLDSRSAPKSEELEPIDCDDVLHRLLERPECLKQSLEEVWRLPYYGSSQMNAIMSSKRVKLEP